MPFTQLEEALLPHPDSEVTVRNLTTSGDPRPLAAQDGKCEDRAHGEPKQDLLDLCHVLTSPAATLATLPITMRAESGLKRRSTTS